MRGVAQPGSAPGLGPGGRRFESCRPDRERWPSKLAISFSFYLTKYFYQIFYEIQREILRSEYFPMIHDVDTLLHLVGAYFHPRHCVNVL